MTIDVWMQHPTPRLPTELVRYLRSRSGRHKVLFGSNFPMIAPAHALAHLASLELDAETTTLYLEGNARAVFGL